ncbi:MAG TPA: phosphoenolpyruvate--protein phosphotransferase [Phycisphaerales bacterium]|nr:phosphoenolpyruvate--protein phosphotransferase [Phycisphaerales bacterium]
MAPKPRSNSSDAIAPALAGARIPISQPAEPPQILKGLGVSSGIVIGRALVLDSGLGRVHRRSISPGHVKTETLKFDQALKASIEELAVFQKQAEREMGAETAEIFAVHQGMLKDKTLIGPIRRMIESELVTAEYAVYHTFSEIATKFRNIPNSAFTTKVNDIDDLCIRLLRHLIGDTGKRVKLAGENTIIIARDLTPSQTAGFDRGKIKAFATDLGGRTGHTAIVARALGIPAVVGCQRATEACVDGAVVVLDGERGVVIVNPDNEQLETYRGLLEQSRVYRLSLSELAGQAAITTDGIKIEIMGNIEFPDEVHKVKEVGGDGIGLYRTEFLYLTSDPHEPTEKEQFQAYRRCVELLAGQPLTIRTLDLGADKYTQSREEIPERNPFLGLRSIRYCLKRQPMFKTQLRAILRASALGPIKMMFPLITSTGEFRQAKYLVNDVMEDLAEEAIPFDRNIKVGMMVEVPSAALMADAFAQEVDFFSIGTNDLVQYTLAVDRTNERVASLYNPAHPAVIRLIRDTVRAARRRNIPVSCCGESASDLEFSILLLGLGLRTLSMTSSAIPDLKRLIRSVSIAQCERIARKVISLDSDVQVSAYLRDCARKIVPEAFDDRVGD